MINVLLCSEGVTEHGHNIFQDGYYIRQEGVLQVLIERCVNNVSLNFIVIPSSRIKKSISLFSKRKIESAVMKKSRALAQVAKDNNCTHIVYHRDEDYNGYLNMRNQVESYFSVAIAGGMKCIAVIPKHMTESWLLSCPGSFPKIPVNPSLPKNPENLPRDPDSPNHPKNYIRKILQQFNMKANADTFTEIANKIDIEVIRRQCPESFEPFYLDMQNFIRDTE